MANSASRSAAAHEPELLPHRGEDEVGVLLGHEPALGLGPLLEALAGDPPVGDGLFRLFLVVGGALAGAALGVEERGEPVELVLLQQAEADDRVHAGDREERRAR